MNTVSYALTSFVPVTHLRELVTSQTVSAIREQPTSSYQDLNNPDSNYQGLYASIPAGGQSGSNKPYAQLRGVRPTARRTAH